MKKRLVLFAATACLALNATPSHAQTSDENLNDARCMVIALGMIASEDAAVRQHGQVVMMYFLGRLDSRSADYDLEDSIYVQNRSMTDAERRAEGARCGGMLMTRGQELIEMGQRITARENNDAH